VARSFPNGARVRTTVVLLISGLLLAGLSPATAEVPAKHGDHKSGGLKHKKHQVEKKIRGAHEDLDESSSQLRHSAAVLQAARARLRAARSHLADTRDKLSAARVLDQRMQAKLVAAEERLAQARLDLAEGRENIVEQRRVLGQIVAANYESGDPGLMGLSMVLTTQNPTELTGQLNSVRNVMDKQAVVLDRLEATKTLLIVQEREVEAAKVEVARQRRAAAAHLVRMKSLEAQAEQAAAQVHKLVDARAKARRQAARAKRADLAQLRKLQRERNRISAVLKRRAEAARRRAMRAARNAGHGSAFAGPRHSGGFLDYPVNGYVTSPFGWRIHPIYGYRSLHDGVDFGASCGMPIRAAAAGTVVERYFQTAWGNRVIIDHGFHRGAGIATISNHMSGPAIVAPGQHVHRGQIVGYVGTTGWSTGCHLHFTVMQNGAPVNPMNWF
jgi:murein DD-endopeptidase MepM/ murein hydrolase activator NlpD